MLHISSRQGNTNQNHNEIVLHIHWDGHHNKKGKEQLSAKMWKNWTHTLRVGTQNGITTLENNSAFLQKS